MPPSKRKSLRFNGNKIEVRLRTAYEEGKGLLLNISTKGCAIVECSLEPEPEDIMLISFDLPQEHGEDMLIEVQGKVLRKQPQLALVFTRVEPETASFLFKFFLHESRGKKIKEGAA